MIQVLPAIIPSTKEQMEDEIKKVSWFASAIQIDISDGIFTPSKTWPYNGRSPDFFEDLKNRRITWPREERVSFELHLMVNSPENILLDWIHTGIHTITVHIEATKNFQKVIDICRKNSVSIGVSIKPSTDIRTLEPFVSQVDFIQVMGSDHLGKHGIELENDSIEMIKRLHALYPERIIAIDIGVGIATKRKLIEAGASKLISGRAILESKNPKEAFDDLSS